MKNSSNLVKVLIWPSKKRDQRSIDRDGHVEICVFDKSYGFLPVYSEMSSHRDLIRGCKGRLRAYHLVDLATWYFVRLREEREEDILDPSRYKNLPAMWTFTFKASVESVQKLVDFLESKIKDPPLYAYYADKPGSHNCQTVSRKALAVSGIFKESSFNSASPDDLLDLLQERPLNSRIVDVKKSQLTPPSFIVIGGN